MTVAEVEASPGGIEEWSKDDVLDIVVRGGSVSSNMSEAVPMVVGNINQSDYMDES